MGDAREGGVEARAFLDTEVLWLDIFRHVLADLLTGRKVVEFLHVSSNPFLIDNDFASFDIESLWVNYVSDPAARGFEVWIAHTVEIHICGEYGESVLRVSADIGDMVG
ncbi:hypothetical protein CXR29_14260 [Brevibacterium linens]|nr:hypothetical protein CXR29_14260 [Brevibacterium linens]